MRYILELAILDNRGRMHSILWASILASAGVALVTTQNSDAGCGTGAAEADGTLSPPGDDEQYVDVCVFPSNADLVSGINAGLYAAGSAIIQVGQLTLIFVDDAASYNGPPASLVQSIASKTGGSIYNTNSG